MEQQTKAQKSTGCHHCGDRVPTHPILYDSKSFCCHGCATVYELLTSSGMDDYYRIENRPGVKVETPDASRFAYLDLPEIQEKLVSFQEGKFARITLKLPAIHCSSCIWLLENLYRLNAGVSTVSVNFTRKEAAILFEPNEISLRGLVELLVKLGYSPEINLSTIKSSEPKIPRALYYKIGIAGFCFGNIMLLSLPEYLGMGEGFEDYARFFGGLNILLSLPVVGYAAQDYYRSAWAGLRFGQVNIDVPITLGIMALFGRSLYEILSHTGAGYMDSLAGLLFFLLIGKWFQEKTYQSLAFDRNYESYFPVAAAVIRDGNQIYVPLRELTPGMEIVVRNRELIPADAELISEEATIDFSFVTGESEPVYKQRGEHIYAGGRQSGPAIRLRVLKEVNQSYLTELWNQQAFGKQEKERVVAFINRVSKQFTFVILAIALGGAIFWWLRDPGRVAQVVTAVLIVACPCALALSAPFSFGHAVRVLGKKLFFLRNADTIEKMAAVTDIVFDKTGTLTRTDRYEVEYFGKTLSAEEKQLIAILAGQSNHPLSRAVAEHIGECDSLPLERFRETPGAGLQAVVNGRWIVLGSERFVTGSVLKRDGATRVFVKLGEELLGYFELEVAYREQFDQTLQNLAGKYNLHLLSGDHSGQRTKLLQYIPEENLHFSQSPFEKLKYVEKLRDQGRVVMMLGDGLNDAGALKAADVGVSVADNVYDFTPACDAIFDGAALQDLPAITDLASGSLRVVKWCIVISFMYNIIGLSFALSGLLSPLVAAILMPVSSISIVVFTTVVINWRARQLKMI